MMKFVTVYFPDGKVKDYSIGLIVHQRSIKDIVVNKDDLKIIMNDTSFIILRGFPFEFSQFPEKG